MGDIGSDSNVSGEALLREVDRVVARQRGSLPLRHPGSGARAA